MNVASGAEGQRHIATAHLAGDKWPPFRPADKTSCSDRAPMQDTEGRRHLLAQDSLDEKGKVACLFQLTQREEQSGKNTAVEMNISSHGSL